MDTLSSAFASLKLSSYTAVGFDLNGPWSFQQINPDGITCFAQLSGNGQIFMNSRSQPISVKKGDCLVLTNRHSFRIVNKLNLAPTQLEESHRISPSTNFSNGDKGYGVFGFAAHFDFVAPQGAALFSGFPSLIHVRRESDGATLHWCIEKIKKELSELKLGGAIVLEHLAEILMLRILRLQLSKKAGGRSNRR
jgi:hypothetical protein